jgi:hypothetical protein
MKARHPGATLTSSLALVALLLAGLQMVVLFHAARPGAQAALQSGGRSVVAPARHNSVPTELRREQGPQRPAVKPPREPRPPSRQFRQNEFAPRPARKAPA